MEKKGIDEAVKEAYSFQEQLEMKRKVMEAGARPPIHQVIINGIVSNLILILFIAYAVAFMLAEGDVLYFLERAFPIILLFAVLRIYNALVANTATQIALKKSVDRYSSDVKKLTESSSEAHRKSTVILVKTLNELVISLRRFGKTK